MSASENSYGESPKDDKFQDYPVDFNDDDSGNEDDGKDAKNSGGKGKKKYSVIPQAVREKFIKRVLSKEVTIKEAAKEFGLKFSTSKAILQTYKKEGRIGKKKNRERKTKILNVVFLCNYTQANSYTSNAYPGASGNDMKAPKGHAGGENNKVKISDHSLHAYPEHKAMQSQLTLDPTKHPQQYIKDLGNDVLKDFIEKSFGGVKMQQLGSLNDMTSLNPAGLGPSYPSTVASASLGNSQNIPSHFNGLASLNSGSLMAPQHAFGMGSNLSQITGLGQFNQFGSHHNLNQKRNFHAFDKDMLHDFELKSEQVNDISAKKFKSGEDGLWDYDLDKSKRDLEDFIYKTHNAIKNHTYVEKTVTFDFSKYRDEFQD